MGGKGKKKKAAKKNGDKKKPAKAKKTGGRKTKRSKSSKCSVDIFTDVAMENAYITCHNVQDLLKWRGFPWPDAQKKKKKGKR